MRFAVNLIQKADQMLKTAPEPIHAPGCNKIKLPPRGSLQHFVEGWSLLAPVRSADRMVDVFLCHFPAVALSDRSQFLKLVFGSLMIC